MFLQDIFAVRLLHVLSAC